MLKETITYKDYNGKERTEDFYFNLTKSEIVERAAVSETDYAEKLKTIIKASDGSKIMETFKQFLFDSYGEKSEDGRRFMKSQELSKAFSETEAYNVLFMRLVTDPDYAANFIRGILPEGIEGEGKK